MHDPFFRAYSMVNKWFISLETCRSDNVLRTRLFIRFAALSGNLSCIWKSMLINLYITVRSPYIVFSGDKTVLRCDHRYLYFSKFDDCENSIFSCMCFKITHSHTWVLFWTDMCQDSLRTCFFDSMFFLGQQVNNSRFAAHSQITFSLLWQGIFSSRSKIME